MAFLYPPSFINYFSSQAINESGVMQASPAFLAQPYCVPWAGPSCTTLEPESLHKNNMWSHMYHKGTELRLPSNHLPTLCHKSLSFIFSANKCQALSHNCTLSLVCLWDPNYPWSQSLPHFSFFVQPVPAFSHYSSCYFAFVFFIVNI